ncbi:MAG: hypothetical protein PHS17_06200 [Desulfobacterales bacterium]|nr:hypothetical protein [Desulfobacterales bacterium]
MAEQTTIQENSTKTQVLKIVRWVVVSAGVLLVLFTFIMAIVRKYGG